MKQLTCEMCGSTDLIKQDGVFVCQSCGCKYSVEEAKKMMVEVGGVVEVTGTVKVDKSNELNNLYKIARTAKANRDAESAIRYYEMIAMQDPTNWEAIFYPIYFRATKCKVGEIDNMLIRLSNCFDTVISLIKRSNKSAGTKKAYIREIIAACNSFANSVYNSTPLSENLFADNHGHRVKTTVMLTNLGQAIYEGFADFEDDTALLAVEAWQAAKAFHEKVNNDPSVYGTVKKEGKKTIATLDSMISNVKRAYEKKLEKDRQERIKRENKDKSADEIILLALDDLRNERFSEALYRFEEIIQRKPTSPVGYLGKAVCIVSIQNEVMAIEQVALASDYTVSDDEKESVDLLLNYQCGRDYKLTLLMYAAANYNYKAVEYLVSIGANVNYQYPEHNVTALWYVCCKQLEESRIEDGRKIAKLLLDKGARIDITNKGGVALYNKDTDPEIAKMILEKYPDATQGEAPAPPKKDKTGVGCLMLILTVVLAFGLGSILFEYLDSIFLAWLLTTAITTIVVLIISKIFFKR